MVNAQRAGVAHVGAQTFDERLIGGGAQRMRIEWRQPPALAGSAEAVRRRADRDGVGQEALIGPGVGAVQIDAECQVAVEPDCHAASRADRSGGSELAVRLPLQILMEQHAILVGACERSDRLRLRIAKTIWPMAPGPVTGIATAEMLGQRLESREAIERRAAGVPEGAERCGAGAASLQMVALECRKQLFEHENLGGGDARIVDQRAVAQCRTIDAGKRNVGPVRHRLDIDVERVEEPPARRRVGACVRWLARKQRVQRVEAERADA